MAGELQADFITGKTLYFLVRDSNGKIWNGAAFETYSSAHYANYPVTGTEEGASGLYTGAMPGASVGIYHVVAKGQAGGSPAEGDATVAVGTIEWDGTLTTSGIGAFVNSVANVQDAAAVNSPATATLKLTSGFDSKTGQTFKTDGVTVKMTQAVTTDPAAVPIRKLGVGA